MHRTACLLGLFASALLAQSPLTTTALAGSWLLPGSTMYFDLVVHAPVLITQVDVNAGPGPTLVGSVDVFYTTIATTFIGPHADPSAWTLGGSGTCRRRTTAAVAVPDLAVRTWCPARTESPSCTTACIRSTKSGTVRRCARHVGRAADPEQRAAGGRAALGAVDVARSLRRTRSMS